jgi:hypothetical protein
MPKATTTPTTSRRSALSGFGLAAIAAGLAVPTPSQAASASPDAELIALCDRLVQLRTLELAMIKQMDEAGDDGDPLEATGDEWFAVTERVRQIDRPLTLAGAIAMARCVVRHCETPDLGGCDFSDWMAIRASEFLAGGEAA